MTTTVSGVKLERLTPGTYRVAAEPAVLVMHLGTTRGGAPGHRYTMHRYGYTGCTETYYSLARACKAYAASRKAP